MKQLGDLLALTAIIFSVGRVWGGTMNSHIVEWGTQEGAAAVAEKGLSGEFHGNSHYAALRRSWQARVARGRRD